MIDTQKAELIDAAIRVFGIDDAEYILTNYPLDELSKFIAETDKGA